MYNTKTRHFASELHSKSNDLYTYLIKTSVEDLQQNSCKYRSLSIISRVLAYN